VNSAAGSLFEDRLQFQPERDQGKVDVDDKSDHGAEEGKHAGDEGQANEPREIDLKKGANE